MHPGAAVRLKGTWKNENTATSTEGSEVEASESISTTAELQVSEVEILGSSDPQVRALS